MYRILHPEIVTNVMRYFLLRQIVSRHMIDCTLGPNKTGDSVIGMDKE